jgi:hypothetical protein
VLCVVLARRFRAGGRPGLARWCLLTLLADLGTAAAAAATGDLRWLWVGGVAVWLWLSGVLAVVLRAEEAAPAVAVAV